jgi:glycosyltransferase involved in cell wall biosynthesis
MARDYIHGGIDVIFIDTGITVNGAREEPQIGAIDDRAGFKLETADPALINDADVIIMHSGAPDIWIVKTQAPLIWVIHGRPLACFRPEINGKGQSYSLYRDVAEWKRTKKMLYFWSEFKPHWDVFISPEKSLCLDFPVIDENRFSADGTKHKLDNPGKYNLLVCDSNREDIDTYELTVGCIEAAKQIPGLKIHFYGIDYPISNAWNILLGKLKEVGGLGDVKPRVTNMELVYRACDCVISPNKIIVRTIAEALCCGIPVISQNGCKVADWSCDMSDANDVVDAIKLFVQHYDKGIHKEGVLQRSKNFNMKNYSKKMNEIYKEVIK